MGLSGAPVSAPFPTSETKATSEYVGPFGRVFIDDTNGRAYMLVDCQEALSAGEWVVIDASGAASALGSSSRGRVGMIAAAVSGSDTAAWAQIYGPTGAVGLCSSEVTSSGALIANVTTDTGTVGEETSTVGNIIFGAFSVAAASTATSPAGPGALGSFVLNYPFVRGVANQFTVTT